MSGSGRARWFAWGLVKGMVLLSMMGIALAAGLLVGLFSSMNQVLPSPDQIAGVRPDEPTRIFSSDGVVLARVARENREYMPVEKIPPILQQATIAIEDKRFYEHPGIDVHGIIRAASANLRRGGIAQGASTITQQLARNLYLTQRRTLTRKLQEMVLALQLERQYSKEEILELYLNEICYGNGAFGVEVAAETYFGKKVSDLSLAESALLAAIPCRPEYYDPFDYPERVRERRNLVLDRMAERGFITEEQANVAKQQALGLTKRRPTRGLSDYRAPYFTSYLLRGLVRQMGVDAVYSGGLRIDSTLNWEMQQVAERILRAGVKNARSLNITEGALVAIDPHNGAIKALVGGIDFRQNQFNCATQARRQAGSAFKPFIYTAAIDSGFTPTSVISDSPVSYPGANGRRWTPHNYDRRYRGRITLERALANSINVVAVKLLHEVGVNKVISYAHRMGISSPLEPYLSLALGTSGVTPLEMCSAYGTLANRGVHAEPMAIYRITSPDGFVEEVRPTLTRAVPTETADTMVTMMKRVVQAGTGTRARVMWPCAGKTGTTSNYKDAWFVGFTQDLVCAVWLGNRNGTPTRRVTGGFVPARIWHDFMTEAVPILRRGSTPVQQAPEQEQPERSETLTYRRRLCADSELLATDACPHTKTVIYTEGKPPYPPRTRCTLHSGEEEVTTRTTPASQPAPGESLVTVTVCRDSGQLAGQYCPRVVDRQFPADRVPRQVCDRHRPPRPDAQGLW